MTDLRSTAARFLFLALVALSVVCHVLTQNIEIEEKPSRTDRLVDQIYYNRYHSNNAKYLVWLLVLVPVFICIPCLLWVWCSDHCLQILKYRNNVKTFKEKKLMNEMIMSNLSDNILNKDLSSSRNQPVVPVPVHSQPVQPHPHQIPIPQPQSHFHTPMGGMAPPPYHHATQPMMGGSQYSSIVPTHVQSSPAYIPNLYMHEPVNLELSQCIQNDHIHRHHCELGSH
ncbi:hypothetical protein OJ253_2482 [Cryptosporidium canis]|uniref:Uncharacterized protein n=1 Tax=Cryptosporidium canis TaxID=195482 RepID=A0A9D5HWY6_9CRYT|nr:hypothetical protein OJ253_2482 [Cryptosporidium canis]